MRRRSRWSTALLLTMLSILTLVAAAAAQQEPGPWIHVEISGESGENINLNLPVAALSAMIAMAPDTIVEDGQLQLGDTHELPVAAIRDMWRELRDVGDAEFVTVQHEGQNVRIAREGETILVNVNNQDGDASEEVRVEVPVSVVDALLSGGGDTLNVRAAIDELSTLRGELVRVIESDSNIRIWINENPTQ